LKRSLKRLGVAFAVVFLLLVAYLAVDANYRQIWDGRDAVWPTAATAEETATAMGLSGRRTRGVDQYLLSNL
jgi:hypothetical protein